MVGPKLVAFAAGSSLVTPTIATLGFKSQLSATLTLISLPSE
jgi:hypothetical protein